MKNFILILMVGFAVSCSSDDDAAVSSFNMTLNGEPQPVYDAYKRVETVNDGNTKTTFRIEMTQQSCGGNCVAKGYVEIQILLPVSESIAGTHVFTENTDSYITGSFNRFQTPAYFFKSGSIMLSKSGGDRYKIVFDNVMGKWGFQYPDTPVPSVLIEGYFDGNFESY